MKPRLVIGWQSYWLGGIIDIHGWYCSGDGRSVFDVTPSRAYQKWWSERPGRIAIQHTHPPKPTFWQKVARRLSS